MKHNAKITIIILSMFVITQFIGLFIVNFYLGNSLPYGFGESGGEFESASGFFSILVAFIVAIALVFLLIRFKAKFVMRFWFFLVVMIALGISFTAILWTISPGYILIPWVAILFAFPIALDKIYGKNILTHNLSELLIYPGVAAIFVPILNPLFLIILLVLISLYDAWAVWKSGIMQKMAKFQMEKVGVFGGFFIPYLSKKQREKMKKLKKKNPKALEKNKIKVNVAILGGGDIVFPIIAAGVMLKAFPGNIVPAILTIIGALAGLTFLLLKSEKKKFYPAMPFITTGIFIAIGISYLVW
jgi:presenilin-like A22 family membrane protease